MNIQVMDEITDTNCYESSSTSSTSICYVKCESIFGSNSCLKGIIIRKAKTFARDNKYFNFKVSSSTLSAPICCKEDESIFKLNPEEVIISAETGNVDIKDLNFNESSDTLSALIGLKKEDFIFKSSPKEVNFRRTETGNIDIKDSNGSLPSLISHKKDGSIFKPTPLEVNFRKSGTGNIDIKDSNFKESSSTPSDLILHKKNDSTFKSNSNESMPVSSADASTCNIDSEADFWLEADNSNSSSICSLSEEECVKILFHDEWETNDDSSDDIIDDELEERLLSFDIPLECSESQANQNARVIRNETLKRKISWDLKNKDEDKSLFDDVDDEYLDQSKRVCLRDNFDDVTSIVLDEVFLDISFQNLRILLYEDHTQNEIFKFLNRHLNNDEKEISSNMQTRSIMAGEMLAEELNHTLDEKENSNDCIFLWMTENVENNLNIYRKYGIKECEMSQNKNLALFKKMFYSEEIQCNTSLLPLASSTCKDQPHQNNCTPSNSSLSESSGSEIKQISLNAKRKDDQSNASNTEYCFVDIDEPFLNIFVHSSVGRKYFWEYLKRRTESLCATYKKIKNEVILSSHVA